MPKGKPKAKYSDLYEEPDQQEIKRKKMAPQAAAHRRGGTHRVKDKDLTGTRFDTMNYAELTILAKEEGVWYKDIRKADMIKKLAEKERDVKLKDRKAQKEFEKQKEERRQELEKKQKEKERRARQRALRDSKRAVGEDVDMSESQKSESDDASGADAFGFGQVMSDFDSWESTSTSETPIKSTLSPIFPDHKLRLFEWPHADMPSPNPPRLPRSLTDGRRSSVFEEPLPRNIPYGAVKLVTTVTGETLELPGRGYPKDVAPDFVPLLSQHTRDCARNGIMVGTLRKAVVQKAADWAARTQIQWWNGRMYFHMPARTTKATLADVYTKWNKKKARDMVKPTKNGRIVKQTPKKITEQKKKEKRDKMIDVYNATENRAPMCYIPSYLDYPLQEDDVDVPLIPSNLFYIRFPGIDLPHYYFWTLPGEWENPTIPNPEWEDALIEDKEDQRRTEDRRTHPPRKTQTRVKKLTIPRIFHPDRKQPKTSKYRTALWNIERELYHNGYAQTLFHYRNHWLANKKEMEWRDFSEDLLTLYPSGKLPEVPPVESCPPSVAEKLAAIEVPSKERAVSPLRGDEPWTRDDNAYWSVVDFDPPAESEDDIQIELQRSFSTPGLSPQALYRRPSDITAPVRNERFDDWLSGLSPSNAPPIASTIPNSPASPALRTVEREEWEELFAQHVQAQWKFPRQSQKATRSSSRAIHGRANPRLVPHVKEMPATELKCNLYSIMNERVKNAEHCRVCLKPLEKGNLKANQRHYQSHRDEAGSTCPFCEMQWGMLDSEWKAAHIFSHNVDEIVYRRRFSNHPLYSLPTATTRQKSHQRVQPYRISKVHFSPNTVERRIAYNGSADTGMDADISSMATTSPRKSSLRRSTNIRSRKPALKANTKSQVIKNTGIHKTVNNSRKQSDTTLSYHEPSTPSDHIPSPTLHLIHRYGADHDKAAWNPRKHSTSGSEHIPSPHLPHAVRYPWDHPNAKYDPRRYSVTSTDSLEYYAGKKAPQTKTNRVKVEAKIAVERLNANKVAKGKHICIQSRPSSAASVGKQSAKRKTAKGPRITIGETPLVVQTLILQKSDERNASTISNASSNNRDDIAAPKGKMRKKRNSLELEPEAKRRPSVSATSASRKSSTSSKDTTKSRQPSTTSPASSKTISKKRKASDLENGVRRCSSPTSASRKSVATLKSSRASKKRKISEYKVAALHRRPSEQDTNEDFLQFINTPFFEDHDGDVLTGHPFATQKESKTKKATSKIAKSTKLKSKAPTPKEVALEANRATTVAELMKRRAKKTGKKTISGRPFVEPLALAPARRLGKTRGKAKTTSASTVDTSLLEMPTLPPKTISPRTPRKKVTILENIRGRRSSAPTLSSPATSSSRHTSSTSSRLPAASRPIKASPFASKASYDVPFSEPRPMVPPNTPAAHLLSERRGSDSSLITELDVGELKDKIGKVKTTRGGLVRELPAGVGKTVAGKAKEKAKAQTSGTKKVEAKKRGTTSRGKERVTEKAKNRKEDAKLKLVGGATPSKTPTKHEPKVIVKRTRRSELERLLPTPPSSPDLPFRRRLSPERKVRSGRVGKMTPRKSTAKTVSKVRK